MEDKRLDEMARVLFPAVKILILTRPDNPRAASLALLTDLAAKHFSSRQFHAVASAREAMRIARELTSKDGLICVAGSLYLVGEVRTDETENKSRET
jgi:dihydrofolate synthase/folylpolyglutamate synthase